MESRVIEWLMEGDPVIRWQTMRDLLDAPKTSWEAERAKVAKEGWGAQFMSARNADGSWPVSRWTGTVWTLLTLIDCGMPPEGFGTAFEQVAGRLMPVGTSVSHEVLATQMDQCHLGFWVRIGAYFGADERLETIISTLLRLQMGDGGWNCRTRTKPKTSHSSFHTTFNVLEGLRQAAEAGRMDSEVFCAAEARALEFMLAHRMYKSDKTGEVVDERFLNLTFPSHWHYTVLRGLDYLHSVPRIRDECLSDALDYLVGGRKANGRWPVEMRIPGVTLFEMEKMGGDSRWNTLRALRVLKSAGR